MTYEDKKQWLRRYRDARSKQSAAIAKAEDIRTQLEHITPVLSGMPHGSGNGDKLADGVLRLIDSQLELEEVIREAESIRIETEHVLAELQDPAERDVLYRRYIILQRFESIAPAMGYSLQRVFQLHSQGVIHAAIRED